MKHLALIIGLFSLAANAAQIERDFTVTKPLMSWKIILERVCQESGDENHDCAVTTMRFTKKSQESWLNVVKQSQYRQYVEEVDARLLSKGNDDFEEALDSTFEAIAFPGESVSIDPEELKGEILEKWNNEVLDEKNILIYHGHISGAFDLSHKFILILNTNNGQAVELSGGYSE